MAIPPGTLTETTMWPSARRSRGVRGVEVGFKPLNVFAPGADNLSWTLFMAVLGKRLSPKGAQWIVVALSLITTAPLVGAIHNAAVSVPIQTRRFRSTAPAARLVCARKRERAKRHSIAHRGDYNLSQTLHENSQSQRRTRRIA
jgi:hypothetical protein